jgi:HAD superfamily hydrolase (TIGR01450 family)
LNGRRRDFTCHLIDIEGVLVRDKRYIPVEGSVAWYNGLSGRGIARCLVSNNTTHAPEALIGALRDVGFDVPQDGLVSALDACAELLQGWGKTRLLWLGSPGLAGWWRARGFELVESGDCDAVVLGVHPGLRISDLDRALPALVDGGAELVALHRNLFWLDESGERRFGPGFYCAGLELAARREAVVVGKPKERLYRRALEKVGARAEDALFISDDPVADLVTAKSLGMGTAFVLSGKYSDHGVLAGLDQEDWPDFIAETPAALVGEGSGKDTP